MRRNGIRLGKGAKVIVGGKTRREDLTKQTLSPQRKVKAKRRAASKVAKASRKAGRARA